MGASARIWTRRSVASRKGGHHAWNIALRVVGGVARGRHGCGGDDSDSGKLTKLKEYPMGKNPNWVEIVDLP